MAGPPVLEPDADLLFEEPGLSGQLLNALRARPRVHLEGGIQSLERLVRELRGLARLVWVGEGLWTRYNLLELRQARGIELHVAESHGPTLDFLLVDWEQEHPKSWSGQFDFYCDWKHSSGSGKYSAHF